MPIFHDPFESPPQRPTSRQSSSSDPRRAWKSRASYDRAPLESVTSSSATDEACSFGTSPAGLGHDRRASTFDRLELMERIKRAHSPTWQQLMNNGSRHSAQPRSRTASQDRPKTPALPSADIKSSCPSTPDVLREHASAGLEIERPRSALHSGDFREKKESSHGDGSSPPDIALATSPTAPWHQSFPAATRSTSHIGSPYSRKGASEYHSPLPTRARAISQSSFVFLPPTSPLVQQSNNTDLDFSSRPGSRQASKSPERDHPRHTFSPGSFQLFGAHDMARSASGTPAARHLRREGTVPYQAHQPRRSLSSFNQFQPHSNPQTPFQTSRRPSFSDASPLHHAPLVGSYEESILRGRMSTTPSRPLDFIAKIGVLGRGQCKPNLRCPPHVTVPFPAVFYSYSSGNGRILEDSPSPYVGLIDLENSLTHPEESGDSGKRRRRHTVPNPDQDDLDFRQCHGDSEPSDRSKEDVRRREKKKRRSTSPKAPPGGCYRIPQQGQLQIVIKNPNKTAVKLFLVPYDLSDMEPGQKTFVRQRSYSAGPIIDMPLSSRKNLGTDRPEAALSNSDDPNDRPILRYLIHLHICCPSKGRYYLYRSIRVVFANRVPDGKEKLRNEIQLPEPRYSAYKPTRGAVLSHATSSATSQLTAEKALRRRSAGIFLTQGAYDQLDGLNARQHPPSPPPAVKFTGGPSDLSDFSLSVPALEPIPFSLSRIPTMPSRSLSRDPMDMDAKSPFKSPVQCGSSPGMERNGGASSGGGPFEKLSKGDVGYGGNAFRGAGDLTLSPGAGLLARKLKGLEVERDEGRSEEQL